MIMIDTDDVGSDRETALIVLAEARRVAPCLDSLEDEDRELAIAILRRTAKRSAEIASTLKRRTAGDWSQERFSPAEVGSEWLPGDRASLAALCGAASRPAAGGPVGCFPPPNPPFRP